MPGAMLMAPGLTCGCAAPGVTDQSISTLVIVVVPKPLTICGVGNAADIQFPTYTSFYNIIIADSI